MNKEPTMSNISAVKGYLGKMEHVQSIEIMLMMMVILLIPPMPDMEDPITGFMVVRSSVARVVLGERRVDVAKVVG